MQWAAPGTQPNAQSHNPEDFGSILDTAAQGYGMCLMFCPAKIKQFCSTELKTQGVPPSIRLLLG